MTDEVHKPHKSGDSSMNLREYIQQSLENVLIGKTVFPVDLKHARDNLDWPAGVREGRIDHFHYSLPNIIGAEVRFLGLPTEVHYIALDNFGHYKIR